MLFFVHEDTQNNNEDAAMKIPENLKFCKNKVHVNLIKSNFVF